MITDPCTHVLAEAAKYRDVREQPRSSNRGVEIDYWLKESGVPLGLPWCCAFVWNIGRQVLGHAWPVPRTALVEDVFQWAEPKGLIRPTPAPGDLFLLYYPRLGRHGHIGFVVKGNSRQFQSIEGNTNPGGGRDGYGVFERKRPVTDRVRFARWAEAVQESG